MITISNDCARVIKDQYDNIRTLIQSAMPGMTITAPTVYDNDFFVEVAAHVGDSMPDIGIHIMECNGADMYLNQVETVIINGWTLNLYGRGWEMHISIRGAN